MVLNLFYYKFVSTVSRKMYVHISCPSLAQSVPIKISSSATYHIIIWWGETRRWGDKNNFLAHISMQIHLAKTIHLYILLTHLL
jgi:hypothetical protein